MTGTRLPRQLSSLSVVLVVLSMGCSSPSGDAAYFISDASTWELKEALDPEGSGSVGEPSLDWYAEYERFLPSGDPDRVTGQAVRLSGHRGSFDQLQQELEGFDFEKIAVRGTTGLGGRGPDGPSIAAVEVRSDYSIMALSYELEVAQLAVWMDELEPASEEQWTDAGGEIRS